MNDDSPFRQAIETEIDRILDASRRSNASLLHEQMSSSEPQGWLRPAQVAVAIGDALGVDTAVALSHAAAIALLALSGELLAEVAEVAEGRRPPSGTMARIGLPLVLNAGDAFFSYAESALLSHSAVSHEAARAMETLEVLDQASAAIAEALRQESRGEPEFSRAHLLAKFASRLATVDAPESLRNAMLAYAVPVSGMGDGSSGEGVASALTALRQAGLSAETLEKLRDSATKIVEAYP